MSKETIRLNVLGINVANLQLIKELVSVLGIIAILCLTCLLAQAFQIGTWTGQVPGKVFQNSETSRIVCKIITKCTEVVWLNAVNAVGSTRYGLSKQLTAAKTPQEKLDIFKQEVQSVTIQSGPAKILSETVVLASEENRRITERGKAAKSRGIQQANPSFKPGTLAIHLPIVGITIATILLFAKSFWDKLNTGLDFEEQLRKEMGPVKDEWNRHIGQYDPEFNHPNSKWVTTEVKDLTNEELIKIYIHNIFMRIMEKHTITFAERQPFDSEDSLTPLERQFGFFERKTPASTLDILNQTKRKSPRLAYIRKQLATGDVEARKVKRNKAATEEPTQTEPEKATKTTIPPPGGCLRLKSAEKLLKRNK